MLLDLLDEVVKTLWIIYIYIMRFSAVCYCRGTFEMPGVEVVY
jgi:hypothetical protein